VRLADLARLMGLLSRISQGPRSTDRPAGLREQLEKTSSGAGYDLYLPAGEPRAAVVAVHGVTAQGARDARLIHFARSLARAQVACAVPTLPGLSGCRWEAADLDVLEKVALALEVAVGQRPGLVGFSYGGSYCLVAAGRTDLAPRIRFVLTFGAYCSLEEVFAGYLEQERLEPESERDWDDRIYLHLVLAAQLEEALSLPAELRHRVHDLLHRYCDRATAEEKRRFFDHELRSLDLVSTAIASLDRPTLRALSPAGQLAGLRCPVSLIHDQHDSVVPPAQAEKLREELRVGSNVLTRLLITPLLSHVDLGALLHPGRVARLVAALAPLVESC
jgi:pimeloyl-ACP methyl ester carboxylesterase